MEVVMPMAPIQAYPSAPSSPTGAVAAGDRLPDYYFFASAPTSPSRANCAFNWEEKPADGDGADADINAEGFDFEFGFSRQLKESTPIIAAADELFEGGRIRPLNNPNSNTNTDLDLHQYISPTDISTSPRSSKGGKREAEVILERAARERGRASAAPSRSRRGTRSLSPLRGGDGDLHQDPAPSSPPSPGTSLMRGCGSRKWRLKDLFLFRSASVGRATRAGSKDPLLRYTLLPSSSSSSSILPSPKLKNGDGSGSTRKGRGSTASLNDMKYATARAAAEETRRTTPLPFHRNSLFGYLRSNPAIHSISRKLSHHSSNRSRPACSRMISLILQSWNKNMNKSKQKKKSLHSFFSFYVQKFLCIVYLLHFFFFSSLWFV